MFRDPWILSFLVILPLAGLLLRRAARLRRAGMNRLGRTLPVRRQVRGRPGRRLLKQTMVLGGLAAGILGMAGPRWGEAPGATRRADEDLMVVLDVSRSMQAEQPSRLTRAVRALQDLVDSARPRGDIRFGLVLGAARPILAFPLTRDYDGLRTILDNIAAGDLPPELWPATRDRSPSGTRLGAALQLAVRSLPNEAPGPRSILLVSDGDDPLTDEEWRLGTAAARQAGPAVHVAGIGDPNRPQPLRILGVRVLHAGRQVDTRMNEEVLQEIARAAGGTYFPLHDNPRPPLASLYRAMKAAHRSTEPPAFREGLPQAVSRHAVFLFLALACFAGVLVLPETISPHERGRRSVLPITIVAWFALMSMGGAALEGVGQFLRAGDAAFESGDYEGALRHYSRAEAETRDPGRVAFNKAAAFHRLGRFAEAADHWRRALDDAAASPVRRARAAFHLGNAAMHLAQGADREWLEKALAAYRTCLEFPPADPNLRSDARANLDLARRLWLEASRRSDPQGGTDQVPSPMDPQSKVDPKAAEKNGQQGPGEKGKQQPPMKGEPGKVPAPGKKESGEEGGSGILQVREGADSAYPLLPSQAGPLLDRALRRIEEERLRYRREKMLASPDVPNW